MIRPVDDFEISALIDGELEPVRAAEVRAAIEQNPGLRDQFLHLTEAHQAWTQAARSADFVPRAAWDALSPRLSCTYGWVTAALALLAVVARIVPKVVSLDLAAAMLIHGLALAGVMVVVVWISGRALPTKDSGAVTSA